MALKGASDALKEKILKNMSERAAETLREEMEYLGPGKAALSWKPSSKRSWT